MKQRSNTCFSYNTKHDHDFTPTSTNNERIGVSFLKSLAKALEAKHSKALITAPRPPALARI